MNFYDLETTIDYLNIYYDKLIDDIEEIEILKNKLQKLCENKNHYLHKIQELNEKIVKRQL